MCETANSILKLSLRNAATGLRAIQRTTDMIGDV